MFRYRSHGEEIIVLAVHWYISYRLSLRDLAEMLAERGLDVYSSTIWRWVQRFVPKFEKRWDRLRKPVGWSWRSGRGPRTITLDGDIQSRRALWLLRRENLLWGYVKVRTCKFLNHIVEQDHRAINRRCSAMHGLKAFGPTAMMIAGVESAHRIRKRQFSLGRVRGQGRHTMKTAWDRALVGY
jgi:transposase-like protein